MKAYKMVDTVYTLGTACQLCRGQGIIVMTSTVQLDTAGGCLLQKCWMQRHEFAKPAGYPLKMTVAVQQPVQTQHAPG